MPSRYDKLRWETLHGARQRSFDGNKREAREEDAADVYGCAMITTTGRRVPWPAPASSTTAQPDAASARTHKALEHAAMVASPSGTPDARTPAPKYGAPPKRVR
jgi:hypothetical protein